jgi:hypothetical protein
MPTTTRAARFALALVTLDVAHGAGDQWAQTSHQASTKGNPGSSGRRACAGHCLSYTATAAVALLAVNHLTGAGLRPGRVVAGLALSAASHYVIDRRTPLRRLAQLAGHDGYLAHATVVRRPGADPDTTGPGTALFHLDQTAHKVFLLAAALVMA